MVYQLGGSLIEARAAEAQERPAFGGFNLLSARSKLADLLSAIGKTQEFSTYTKHDISHIDALLLTADWLIPKATFEHFTVGDALVLTLSIYVHDLGMLVTKDEFAKREQSTFPSFKNTIMSDKTSRGLSFRHRLSQLDDTEREHFIYEEFVRTYHAQRVEAWVAGVDFRRWGISDDAADIVSEIFRDLPGLVREDIALVARSHHLNDLYDFKKYRLNRSYSASDEDIVNVQYCALILRTSDLLHMTNDRTPTIQYRLASPTDPMGQREWKKQMAVRAVRPADVDLGTQSSAIEVHGKFDNSTGYFGLNEFLDYCVQQLRETADWAKRAHAENPRAKKYEFPWCEIDRDNIEASGFRPNHYKFTFDHTKVLELLTGHTLYNDSSVAIREIVQNSIDAIRLRNHNDVDYFSVGSSDSADIIIEFNSEDGVLTVLDHGVGMTLETIQQHFLCVGSSGYQTETFKNENPGFVSISRFGIGVLAAFMIADEVEVATRSLDDKAGQELVLRSVNGQYLIKDLDPFSEVAKSIGECGTRIRLKLRSVGDLDPGIEAILRKWILFPDCKIVYQEDKNPDVEIGFSGAECALEASIAAGTFSGVPQVTSYKFAETEVVIPRFWDSYYEQWSLIWANRERSISDSSEVTPGTVGVAIQGIYVTDSVPGFEDESPVLLVDVKGGSAPRTNVARSEIEAGEASRQLVRTVYSAIVQSLLDGVTAAQGRVSLRFALGEAAFLYDQATKVEPNRRHSALSENEIMHDVLSSKKLFPVEFGDELRAWSCDDLLESGFSVTVGAAASDAARFLEWSANGGNLAALLRSANVGFMGTPDADNLPLLSSLQSVFSFDALIWKKFEITKLEMDDSGANAVIQFARKESRWSSIILDRRPYVDAMRSIDERLENRRTSTSSGSRGTSLTLDMNDRRWETGIDSGVEILVLEEVALILGGGEFHSIATRLRGRPSSDSAREMSVLSLIARDIYLRRTALRYYDAPDRSQDVYAEWVWEYLDGCPEREALSNLVRTYSKDRVWSSVDLLRKRRARAMNSHLDY